MTILHMAHPVPADRPLLCWNRDDDADFTEWFPGKVTCEDCRRQLDDPCGYAGAPTYVHPDGRACWWNPIGYVAREAWRTLTLGGTTTRACLRAHMHRLVPGGPVFAAEDAALADLAQVLSDPLRTRLRALLKDATL